MEKYKEDIINKFNDKFVVMAKMLNWEIDIKYILGSIWVVLYKDNLRIDCWLHFDDDKFKNINGIYYIEKFNNKVNYKKTKEVHGYYIDEVDDVINIMTSWL